MTKILLNDLKTLAELAPDLPLGQAFSVLEWITGSRDAVVQLAAPADPVIGGGSAMSDPSPAVPAVAAAGTAAITPVVRGERWTKDEIERAWALKKAGHTVSDIARRLGRPTAATGQMFKRQRWLGQAPIPPTQKHQPWSPADLAAALAMRANGATYAEIAARYGRTTEATRVALTRKRVQPIPEIPTEESADAERSTPPEAPCDADDAAAVPLVDDGRGGGAGLAENGLDHDPGPESVPAVAEARPAADPERQPAGLGDLGGVAVADAPRLDPAPVEPPAPPASTRPPDLSMRQNWLLDHLRGLPDDFTPEDDLYLVEGLLGGTPPAVVADQLGCDLKAVVGRFRSMQTEEILTVKGQLTLSGQQDLLAACRYRAAP